MRLERYWDLDFAPDEPSLPLESYAEELRELLLDATKLRLNADVTVGAYLSGGLDSSTITQLALAETETRLKTFSIAFEDPSYDERAYQEAAVRALSTDHVRVECRNRDIAQVFRDVVWHAESPILRTAPAPMYLLSQLVHEHGVKVVLTGEGADEVLGGYNIFKENSVRRFWAREPTSRLRPLMLCRLYPYIAGLGENPDYLSAFFGRYLTETDHPGYSHIIRWSNTAHLRSLLSPDLRESIAEYDPIDEVTSLLVDHPRFGDWTPLARAQFIEMTLFMSGYLLSSQGDRMQMAHSVEGRFPFLDHRVVEFAARMPDRAKLRGLDEKHVLKRAMRDSLPPAVVERTKQPYRAPIQAAFADSDATADLLRLACDANVRRSGIFNPKAATALLDRMRRPAGFGERDNMALAAVVSTLLLNELFVDESPRRRAVDVQWTRRVLEASNHA